MVVLELEQEEIRAIPEWIADTMMSASYAEARSWIDWIRVFTVSDLADTMVVDWNVAEQFTKAASWHGIIFDTGDVDRGEIIWEYVPLPPGPTHHPHGPIEWKDTPGIGELAPRTRGMPIRIRSERDMRRILSTSGAAAVHRRRQKAYERQLEAVAKRKEAQAKKAKEGVEDKKWRKHKKNSIVV